MIITTKFGEFLHNQFGGDGTMDGQTKQITISKERGDNDNDSKERQESQQIVYYTGWSKSQEPTGLISIYIHVHRCKLHDGV